MGQTLREALLRSGAVSEADVTRLETERAEAEARAAELLAWARARKAIAPNLLAEMTAWERGSGRAIPLAVYREWALLDYPGQLHAWARWLAAAREEGLS